MWNDLLTDVVKAKAARDFKNQLEIHLKTARTVLPYSLLFLLVINKLL